MGRGLKRGVDYYSLDVNFVTDDKTRLIKGEFGLRGVMTMIYLLSEIYGDEGYYKIWGEVQSALLAEKMGSSVTPKFIGEVIGGCIRCGFFSKTVFESFGALTSAGIQRRYIRATAKREAINIISQYWLLNIDNTDDVPGAIYPLIVFSNISGNGNAKSGNRKGKKTVRNTQSKVNESKLNEIKESTQNDVAIAICNYTDHEELTSALEEFAQHRISKKKPLTVNILNRMFKRMQQWIEAEDITDNVRYRCECLYKSIDNKWTDIYELTDFIDSEKPPKVHYASDLSTGQDVSDIQSLSEIL